MRVRLDLAGFGKGQLGHFVFHDCGYVQNLAETLEVDHARPAVDLGADVLLVAVFRASGLLDRFLHRLDDDFTVYVFSRATVSATCNSSMFFSYI